MYELLQTSGRHQIVKGNVMKNIQIIDGAVNCTYSVFQATDEEFSLLFPEQDQDIQFSEDLETLALQEEVQRALRNLWERPIRKRDALGIHGTIFYELPNVKDLYRAPREEAVDPSAINQAQRRLFGSN